MARHIDRAIPSTRATKGRELRQRVRLAAAVVVAVLAGQGAVTAALGTAAGATTSGVAAPATGPSGSGYSLTSATGAVYTFSSSAPFSSTGALSLNKPMVGIAGTSDAGGYWQVAGDGGVFATPDATFHGSVASTHLNAPVVGMAPTADNGGYWLVASDGGVFAELDAQFHGSMGGTHLNAPVVGMAATPTGGGYWLAAADGGVFALGNAPFHGSAAPTDPSAPVVGIAATPTGGGYWLVTSAGQVFHFGNANGYGSPFGSTINGTIVAIDTTSDGGGYWLVGSDGGVYAYGDAPFLGSLPGQKITVANIVGITGHGTLAPVPPAPTVPRLASVTPTGGKLSGGTTVTLTGSGFAAGATVAFGAGNPGTTVHVVSASQITVKAPAHAAGTVTVTVTTAGGTSNAKNYVYHPVPTITSLTPTAGKTAGGTLLTIHGTGFTAGTTVSMGGGHGTTVHVVSTTQLTVKVPAHAAGTVTVTVTALGGTSNAKPYTYDSGPSLTSLTPTAGKLAGGTTVTLTGSNFVTGATVAFGTMPGTTVQVVSTSQITVKTPPGGAETVTVTVTTPGGSSNAKPFTYDPVPTLTKVTPNAGKTAGGTTLTLTGSGFRTGATTVTFGSGNHGVTVHVTGTTSLTVKTPAHATATVTVTVTTPGGTSGTQPYTYDPVPTLTKVTPNAGKTAGGTTLTLTGSGFRTGATTVTFGSGNHGVTVHVTGTASLTVKTPAHATATVTVTVTTPGGTSGTQPYTYDPVPTLTKVTPNAGKTAGGTTLTLTGSGFRTGATTVTFGSGNHGVTVHVTGTASLTVKTPAHATATVTVTVTTPGGTSGTQPYSYDPVPTLTKITPTTGKAAGGNTVTLTGSGFRSGATTVEFGTTKPGSTVDVLSTTSLTVKVPAHAAGTVGVFVTTPGGKSGTVTYHYEYTPLVIKTTSLPSGRVGTFYTTSVSATGGTGSYTWTISTLPTGLTYTSSDGQIYGTPTTTGTYTVEITVTDGMSTMATVVLRLHVTAPLPLVITTTSLPSGTQGHFYTATLSASGGIGSTYTWTISTLPTGLTYTNGNIYGTPTVSGTYTVHVRVSDGHGDTATATLTLHITATLPVITTTSLPDGRVGSFYTTSLSASGGTGTYTWTISGLPTGLTYTSFNGQIYDTPTTTGTYTVHISVTDGYGDSATTTLNLHVTAPLPLVITTTSLPSGTQGHFYTATVHASGGIGSTYTWTITGLPTGLTYTSFDGNIYGTPTVSGTFTVHVRVSDGHGDTATATLTLHITATLPVITTTSLPDGRVGSFYTTSLSATGGTGTYTWTISGLPTGLTYTSFNGQIYGTPTTTGTFTVHVVVTDGYGTSATTTLNLHVTAPPAVVITTTSLPSGTQGQFYTATLHASGGIGSTYTWTISTLPTGLTYTSFDGNIYGTPTVSGTYTIHVYVSDGHGDSTTATLTLHITATPPVITTTSLPDGTVGSFYTTFLSASGGTGSYTWTISGLPTGLTYTSFDGQIYGTPTTTGTFTVHVVVTDGYGTSATTTLNLHVTAPPAVVITTTSLPSGTQGQFYTATLHASGGIGSTYTWTISTLPTGLTYTSFDGNIYGTPTVSGTYTIHVYVSDGHGDSTTATLTLHITATPPVITTTSLPDGTVGSFYTTFLSASGGTGSYTWTISGLPTGLTYTSFDGQIYGTPTTTGTFTVHVVVTDGYGTSATTTLNLHVTAPPAVVITTTSLPSGTQGQFYTATLHASGGIGSTYTWTISTLPTGLTYTSFDGNIYGTPTVSGTYTIHVYVSDGHGDSTTATLTLHITATPPVITTTSLPDGTVGSFYTTFLSASGGTGSYTWTISGLPTGLTYTSFDGQIYGTPTTTGTFTVHVVVTDGYGTQATTTLSLTIFTT